jgi:predicted O-methyltransferase YrrM
MRLMRAKPYLVDGLKDLIEHTSISDGKMIELGCYVGESTEIFASSGKFSSISAIDPWEGNYDNKDFASRADMSEIEKAFDERMKGFDNIKKVKLKGNDAVDQFEDKSLDLVYIDACHTYKAVKNDIEKWLPKLKDSGFMAGHDIRMRGVRNAIHQTVGKPDKKFSDDSWVVSVKKVRERAI